MDTDKYLELRKTMPPQWISFCEHYAETLNATKSCELAGYKGKYLRKTGHDLLQKPQIEEYIRLLRLQQMEKMGITKDRVLQEYARIAFADPRKLYDENGAVRPITELDDDTAATIAQVTTKELHEREGRETKYIGDMKTVKTHSKVAALDAIGRHLGLNQLDNEQKQSNVVVVTGEEAKEIWKSLNDEF